MGGTYIPLWCTSMHQLQKLILVNTICTQTLHHKHMSWPGKLCTQMPRLQSRSHLHIYRRTFNQFQNMFPQDTICTNTIQPDQCKYRHSKVCTMVTSCYLAQHLEGCPQIPRDRRKELRCSLKIDLRSGEPCVKKISKLETAADTSINND